MPFRLALTPTVREKLDDLARRDARKLRKVRQALGMLQPDPRYPGLNSHKREVERGLHGEDVWESYIENNTPSAWRVLWYYGPDAHTITVVLIAPHD